MTLVLPSRPSQGAGRLKLTSLFLTAGSVNQLTTDVNAILDIVEATPQGVKFIADLQFSSAQISNNQIRYSCMIIKGEWSP